MSFPFHDNRPGIPPLDPERLTSGLRDAVDGFRNFLDSRGPQPRAARGNVRAAVLALLLEGPQYGYQIIQQITERSGGTWKPSPGSVYPTLQLLLDEGLVRAEESEGRKTYSLTESGREVAEASAAEGVPWLPQEQDTRDAATPVTLATAGTRLAQATGQVASNGTPEQITEAAELLEETRRKIYAILARA